MASNVSNAFGTQRQFSARPQAAYERSLNKVAASATVAAPTGNDGIRLAQSLGVLGNALDGQLEAREKNLDKVCLADAERVSAGLTDSDWRTKTALTLLNEKGAFNTADKPYAVAMVEKMRGKYFSAQADSEYQLWRKDKGNPKTAADEAAQYQKFMHDKFGEVSSIASNAEAFNAGYFDNFIPQTVKHVNDHIKQKSEEYDVSRVGGTQAALGNIALTYNTMDAEQTTAAVNKAISDAQVAGGDSAEIYTNVEKFVSEFAERSGDVDKLSNMFENVMVPDGKGGMVKLGSKVDMSHAVKIAETVKRSRWDKEVDDKKNSLLQMSVDQIHAEFDRMEKEDNHLFQTMAPLRDTIITERKTAEEKVKKQQRKALAQQLGESAKTDYVRQRLGLYVNGASADIYGKPIEQSTGDFAGKVKVPDPENPGSTKDVTITQSDINMAVQNQLEYYASQNLPDGELADASFKLLEWGPAKDYADSFKQVMTSDLGSLSLDKLGRDGDGNAVLSGNIKSAMVMFHSNHDRFANVFGESVAKKIATLDLIRGGTGSLEEAVDIYAKSRSNRESADIREKVDKAIGNMMPQLALDNFTTLDGASVSLDVEKGYNWDMGERVRSVAEALLYGGYSEDEAKDLAAKYARNTYFSYRGSAMPKGLFEQLAVDDKMTNGKYVLDDTVSFYKKEHPDLADSAIWVDYDESTGVYTVNGGGYTPHVWDRNSLVDYGNKRGTEWTDDTSTPQITPESINAEKAKKAAESQNPEVVYYGD